MVFPTFLFYFKHLASVGLCNLVFNGLVHFYSFIFCSGDFVICLWNSSLNVFHCVIAEVCDVECVHGTCHDQRCQCEKGWAGNHPHQIFMCHFHIMLVSVACELITFVCTRLAGSHCDQVACDARCDSHGFCNNGTCICKPGWNGRHCTLGMCSVWKLLNHFEVKLTSKVNCIDTIIFLLNFCYFLEQSPIYFFVEGCPSECHNNGACQLFQDGWKCSCRDGWKGIECNVAMEVECDNSDDDDKG